MEAYAMAGTAPFDLRMSQVISVDVNDGQEENGSGVEPPKPFVVN